MNFINLKKFFFAYLLFSTMSAKKSDVIFVTSIPKCGTHLLTKCISLLTKKEPFYLGPKYHYKFDLEPSIIQKEISELKSNKYLIKHLNYNDKINNVLIKNNCKVLFIYRDPRDQMVSWTHHMNNHSRKILDGINKNITENYYIKIFPWALQPNVLAIRFEDIIGPQGGGSDEKQFETINKIAKYLKLKLPTKEILHVCNNLFGGTTTFVKGQIGRWKVEFSDEIKQLFKEKYGQLIIDLDYEKDLNW
jgi:sulfotransferase 6B1